MDFNIIHRIDCVEGLRGMPDEVVDCIVTSPPYYGLRDYGVDGQVGLEDTPELYVQRLVEVFTEARRVLKKEGSLWLNLGDSYWGGKGQSGAASPNATGSRADAGETLNRAHQQLGGKKYTRPTDKKHPFVKPKDLIGIPWMVAFALRQSGWWLRQEIIWHKPNPMPESVTDRCTRAHEQIFHLTKSSRYYYDAAAIKTPAKNPADDLRRLKAAASGHKSEPDDLQNGLRPRTDKQRGHSRKHAGFNARWDGLTKEEQQSMGANKRSVWSVSTKPFKEAHFATFPPDLITDCIKAGCPIGGIVLDPFMGAGTTALEAWRLGRNFIGFELNPAYANIAENRLEKYMLR